MARQPGREYHWFIPNSGDGRYLAHTAVHSARGSLREGRRVEQNYLRLVARAAESAGFDGAVLTTGPAAEDGFVLAAGMAPEVPRLQLMVLFTPGVELPLNFAQKIATLQRIAGGRIALGIVNGSATDQRRVGDFVAHDGRYARMDEFLRIAKSAWRGEAVEHAGVHYLLGGSGVSGAAGPVPLLYMFGASDAGAPVIARHADVHLLLGEPPPMLRTRISKLRALAERTPRDGAPLRFGLRVQVIARATEAQAWDEAQRLLDGVPAALVQAAQSQFERSDSVGQQRMRSLHQGVRPAHARALEVYPNLWAGIGLVRAGSGTALVGSYAQVAARIDEYAALGISRFVFSSYPNLEEAQRVGQEVLPRVAA